MLDWIESDMHQQKNGGGGVMKELKRVFGSAGLPGVKHIPAFSVRVDRKFTNNDRVFLVLVAGSLPTIEIPFDHPIAWEPFAGIEGVGEELVQAAELAEAMESCIAETGVLAIEYLGTEEDDEEKSIVALVELTVGEWACLLRLSQELYASLFLGKVK